MASFNGNHLKLLAKMEALGMSMGNESTFASMTMHSAMSHLITLLENEKCITDTWYIHGRFDWHRYNKLVHKERRKLEATDGKK
tara:strand:+ start:2580 stop:2831 length:252 start_codon:yes stop_codon:yes gene_type:complete